MLLWVEVKHGADPHDGQLLNYVADIQFEPGHGQVILLAPRRSLPRPDADVPVSVAQRSWQRTARVVHRLSRYAADPVERWILEELYCFMADQQLTEPQTARPEHFVAMAYMEEAMNTLIGVSERASSRIRQTMPPPTEFLQVPRVRSPTPDHGLSYYESWEAGGRTDVWLDWNIYDSPRFEQADGRAVMFVSGFAADTVDALNAVLQPERKTLLESGVVIGKQYVRFHRLTDDLERFAQIAAPEAVLVGRDLDEQGAALGDWVAAGLAALTVPLDQMAPGPA